MYTSCYRYPKDNSEQSDIEDFSWKDNVQLYLFCFLSGIYLLIKNNNDNNNNKLRPNCQWALARPLPAAKWEGELTRNSGSESSHITADPTDALLRPWEENVGTGWISWARTLPVPHWAPLCVLRGQQWTVHALSQERTHFELNALHWSHQENNGMGSIQNRLDGHQLQLQAGSGKRGKKKKIHATPLRTLCSRLKSQRVSP